MHWQRVRAIVRKDLTAVRRSRPVLVPLIVLPLIFFVAMPVAFALMGRFLGEAPDSELEPLIRALPASDRAQLERLEPGQQIAVVLLSYQLAPFMLIVPLAVATAIAADSLAGERERRTLEALLATPIRDEELFFGKVLAAALPAIAIGWLGTFVEVLVSIAVTGVGPPLLPSVPLLILALLGVPGVAFLGLGTVVLISARVRGFQEVMQLSGLLAMPLIGVMVAQASGLFLIDWRLALLGCVVVWAAAFGILRAGRRLFQREALFRLG